MITTPLAVLELECPVRKEVNYISTINKEGTDSCVLQRVENV